MKIMQVHSAFHPAAGGVENYAYGLCRELVKRGCDVTVVTSTISTNKKTMAEEHDGIKIRRLKPLFKIGYTPVVPGLYSELKKTEVDIIHTHLPTPYTADVAAYVAKHRNIPCVLTYHNDIVGKGIKRYIAGTYNTLALNKLLDRADRIIITQPGYVEHSPFLKKYKGKIRVIPCGVDINVFRPLPAEKQEHTVFFLSILNQAHEYKGLDNLMESLALVKKEIPDVKLIVGGAGDLTDYYKNRAESAKLKDSIDFCGFIPDVKLVEYYNKAGVFVLPSVSSSQEGFGMVLLEALACRTPVVTTSVTGVAKDVQENNAGLVVEPGDNTGLAGGIIKILKDSQLAARMGDNGRKLVENKYSWDTIGTRILNIYGGIT
jgi:glycosyltransferase involved in cell wall biosynthesis